MTVLFTPNPIVEDMPLSVNRVGPRLSDSIWSVVLLVIEPVFGDQESGNDRLKAKTQS